MAATTTSTGRIRDSRAAIRASRLRVPRSRGAVSGLLLVLLGLWGAFVPFIGPYFDFGFGAQPGNAWHWTAARGYLDVAGGAAAALGGLILLFSASRVVTSFGGWLAAAGGAWLVIGPPLTPVLHIGIGQPDPSLGTTAQAMEQLFYFCALGAGIVLLAGIALGRLSVHSLRDVRAAEKRGAAEDARAYEAERVSAADRHRHERAPESTESDTDAAVPSSGVDTNGGATTPSGTGDDRFEQRWTPGGSGRHERGTATN